MGVLARLPITAPRIGALALFLLASLFAGPRHTVAGSTPNAPEPTIFSLSAAWPMVGHDAGQSYADPVGSIAPSSLPYVHVRWQAAGETPQIEAAGLVYVLAADGRVTALDAVRGTLRHQYQSTNVQGLALRGPLIYLNRRSEIRIVTAATSDWTHSATDSAGAQAAAFDSFILSGGTLFTGVGPPSASTVSRYYAFDARTGKQLWQRSGSLSSIPCVADGTLYLGFGGLGSGNSYLLDPTTGAVRRVLKDLGTAQWHAAGGNTYASILRGGGSSLRASINAYDRSGNVRWTAHDILFGAALPDIMFGIAPGAVDARSAIDGHRLWKTLIPGLQSVGLGSLVVSGNLALVQATDGRISILNRDDGRLLRVLRPPFSGIAAGNLIVGGGIIFESLSQALAGGKAGPTSLLAFGP
jgi:outer membrane protein assembly factor BamB